MKSAPIPNKQYNINKDTIDKLLTLLDANNSKNVLYVGYAKNELIKVVNENYNLFVCDWFTDSIDKSDLNDIYLLKGLDWTTTKHDENTIGLIPEHDTLLLDADVQWDFKTIKGKLPDTVIIFGLEGKRQTFRHYDYYDWEIQGNVQIGKSIFNDRHKLSPKILDKILFTLDLVMAKKVFYLGASRPELISVINDKYNLVVGDCFDRTQKSASFWYEGEEEEGYPPPIVPEWAKDIQVQIEGMPEHDVLIIDLGVTDWNFKENNNQLPSTVIFIDDELKYSFNLFRHTDDYKWYYEERFYVGSLIANTTKSFEESIIEEETQNNENDNIIEKDEIHNYEEVDDSFFDDPEGKYIELVERVDRLESSSINNKENNDEIYEKKLKEEVSKSFPNYELIEKLLFENIQDSFLVNKCLNLLYTKYSAIDGDLQNTLIQNKNTRFHQINLNYNSDVKLDNFKFLSLVFSNLKIHPVNHITYYYVLLKLSNQIHTENKSLSHVSELLKEMSKKKNYDDLIKIVKNNSMRSIIDRLLVKTSFFKEHVINSYISIIDEMFAHIENGGYLIVNTIEEIYYDYLPTRNLYYDRNHKYNYIEYDLFVYNFIKSKFSLLENDYNIRKQLSDRDLIVELIARFELQNKNSTKHIMNIFNKDFGKEELYNFINEKIVDMIRYRNYYSHEKYELRLTPLEKTLESNKDKQIKENKAKSSSDNGLYHSIFLIALIFGIVFGIQELLKVFGL